MLYQQLLRHPISILATLMSDPVDAAFQVRERVANRISHVAPIAYHADPHWEAALQSRLGLPADNEFAALWMGVVESLRARGLKVGPFSFYGWNDGDAGFVRALWRVIRQLRPERVVETGVAHGVTSRFILEALRRNAAGRLWSIDLPPFDREKRKEVGVAVDEELRANWCYVGGTSRNRLPKLLDELKRIELFVHDSSHTDRNVTFELETVWPYLRPGGVIMVDDIDVSPAFRRFADRHPDHLSLVCEAEPLAPDQRRFNQKGLFGIICRNENGRS